MPMFRDVARLLAADEAGSDDLQTLLTKVGFHDWQKAAMRLRELGNDFETGAALAGCLPLVLHALSETAIPDASLINFERYVQSVEAPVLLFNFLTENPRAIEILVRLFVGSQFLTEILLRNPTYLEKLTRHKRLAEYKSRQQFQEEALETADEYDSFLEKLDALRRFQHWELLRIGACDSFGLMDLKSVTVQLSLQADALVQSCLILCAADMDLDPAGFTVLAFGKLGGEELNYSSDIDLVFLADTKATRFWGLGQRLIKAVMDTTGEGFLYRVDMRLRPWGRSGALVNTVDAHIDYLSKHGQPWEKQALLKARVIAGDLTAGRAFLKRCEPLIFEQDVDVVRESVQEMKQRIEDELQRQGREWGEVKSGAGSIRDIEFITQFLQIAYGGEHPAVRSINTLDGLVRLADFGFIHADEYRQLSSGYVFLRVIEHSLQLVHHKQTHSIPEDRRELAYLARRLDFSNAAEFVDYYEQHRNQIRTIFEKYISGCLEADQTDTIDEIAPVPDLLSRMEPSYAKTFSEEEIACHVALLKELSDDNIVDVEACPLDDGSWRVTVVGFDMRGDLSMICGLLFVYGFNIVDGNVFTAEQVAARSRSDVLAGRRDKPAGKSRSKVSARRFVDVFSVSPPLDDVLPEVWTRYKRDLTELFLLCANDNQRAAQGTLAKRVAGALREIPETDTSLYSVEIEIDNESSEKSTVLDIYAEDTKGFLYEFCNALAISKVDINRMIVGTDGNRVHDVLFVTDAAGKKITDAEQLKGLRSAVVLIKHFTHLLPRSPNPESALLHFQDFLEQLFQQPDWLEELASLERSDVLDALARLLGVSNFLWEDFLRLQHENLFPVVRDIESLAERKSKRELETDLALELKNAEEGESQERRRVLNAFKDREMFRADMRHILGLVKEFGSFADELTDVADVVVGAAYAICEAKLTSRYGKPRLASGQPCPLSVLALGKCGGRELGYASDIELMFVYEDNGKTDGPTSITNTEYFLKLVESFRKTIQARQEGIFQIDLRLRPYGRAGSLAVALDAFEQYFGADGAAWPYERQALVKLRAIAGDENFGQRVVMLRDALIYSGEPFDVTAMRAMREKQNRQLVQAGTFNAKLSPGGLVDSEYLVQGLQITHGHDDTSLRETNTLAALAALEHAKILSAEYRQRLRYAYAFQRKLIDALRMVRGHAKDLTVPSADSEEFEFLARRLGYGHPSRLSIDLEAATADVLELACLLDDCGAS
jgi:glutamate-ammonia-ligase adenylyltransferase